MTKLINKRCAPCNGTMEALPKTSALELLGSLPAGWQLDEDGKSLSKDFTFKGFYKTMAFVNSVAWIAHQEGHHPDMEIGYAHCRVHYTTHELNGLSTNDYICAAKVDALQEK